MQSASRFRSKKGSVPAVGPSLLSSDLLNNNVASNMLLTEVDTVDPV